MTGKDAFWFPHDTNAHNDPRMIRLRRLGDWQAVGVYWAFIEILRGESGE